jgi:hypothetical protein
MRSPGLVCPVFKQASGHPGPGEPTAHPPAGSSGDDNDLIVPQLEVHFVAWLQTRAVPQCLGDHNLSLRADPTSHTWQV